MSKRWATRPRGIQWLVWIAVVVLALAIVWALFVPLADWLARHDVGSAKGSLHETALDNARGRLLTLGAGLFAAGALVFTARNFTLSRRTFELTEQGQVTDRYTKAIEQLGSEKLDVRIGGIYALEHVARDSARDHPTVMEVLTAFVREHSRDARPEPDPGLQGRERSIRPDVQAAVTVIARRNANRDVQHIDLSRADLSGADLTDAHLTDATLFGAYLTGATLFRANLTGAWLTDAHLTGANFTRARVFHANLTRADLTGANLTTADLTGANLIGADLTNADLTNAKLTTAYLTRADLTGADLTNANFTNADLTDAQLTGAVGVDANFTGARWPAPASVPEGWKLDPGSGRLEQAGTGSRPPEAD